MNLPHAAKVVSFIVASTLTILFYACDDEESQKMPVIESFTPELGPKATTVTIHGKNLGGSQAIVQFNGANAVSSGTQDQLIAIVPAAATTGKITIKVKELTTTSATDFTVLLPPTISAIEPSAGAAGTTVTITGTNFDAALSGNVVRFNEAIAEVTEVTSTQLKVVVPQSATSGKISVTTAGGTISSGGNFTINVNEDAPVIESFTPGSARVAATVTIKGRNLGGSNALVQFNGINAVSSGTQSQLVAIVPDEATTGKITVKVNDLVATSSTDFTVLSPPPSITLFEPTTSSVGATVTIIGTNFSTKPSDNVVKFNAATAEVTEATNTQLKVIVPASATTGKISVTTAGGTVASLGTFIYLPPPSIVSFSPTQALVGQEITITGSNFSTTAVNNTVKFNNAPATVLSSTPTTLVAVVPNTATTGKITVTTNGVTATSSENFVLLLPPILFTSRTPAYGLPGTTVTITGSNFASPASANIVTFNNIAATVISGSSTSLEVTVPANASSGAIKIATADGNNVTGDNFEVLKDIPRNGLIAFFPFNGDGADKATNNPARAFNMAAADAPTYTTDRFGKTSGALNFNGSQYAVNTNDLVPDRPWTISFFMKYETLTANEGLFTTMTNGVGFEAHFNERWLLQGAPNPNAPWAIDMTGDSNGATSGGEYLPVDPYRYLIGYLNKTRDLAYGWMNVTITYDGSFCTLYIDASNWGDSALSVTMPEVTQFIFGSSKGNHFNGQLDDLIIYNRALSDAEVIQLKNHSLTKYNDTF